MGTEVEIGQGFVLEDCYSCGVTFALRRDFQRHLMQSHQPFYCPNGHGQCYLTETREEKLRCELTKAHQENNVLSSKKAELERKLNDTLSEVGKLAEAARAGLCPYCQKYIPRLRQHIASKHPEKNKGG